MKPSSKPATFSLCVSITIIGCGVNYSPSYPSIHHAVRVSDYAAVRWFIDQGADIDDPGSGRFCASPLMFAVTQGDKEMVVLLLEAGADTEVRPCENQLEFLLSQAERGNSSALIWLKGLGFDSAQAVRESEHFDYILEINQMTPLANAASYGQTEMVALLLNYEANIEARTANGATPLTAAVYAHHIGVGRLLIENGADVNAPDKDFDTPFLIAISQSQLELVKLMMTHGANPLERHDEGRGAMESAGFSGNPEMIDYLLELGVPVNQPGYRRFTALQQAILNGQLSIVSHLIENGANVNAVAENDVRPIHLAAYDDHKDIIDYLVKAGAEIDAPGYKTRSTALHIAAKNGHADTVSLLLKHGADPRAEMTNGSLPEDIAENEGHVDCVALLEAARASLNLPSE